MIRLGVFLVPPPEHPFYTVTTGILGYDVWARRRQTSILADHLDAPTLERWIGEAASYGIHCTIVGGAMHYDDRDVDEIGARLSWIASRTAPFTLANGRFFDEFHARPRALVARFDGPDGALDRLHRQVATLVSPLHVETRCRAPQPGDDERAQVLYTRFGETHVLERFSAHWSLMSGLPDDASWSAARDLVARRTSLFADERTRTVPVEAMRLVAFDADGFCYVASSYPLAG